MRRGFAEAIVAAEETARLLASELRPPEPEGVSLPFREKVDHDLPLLLRPVQPFFSVYIYNEGPDPADTLINGGDRSFRLEKGQSRQVDMGAPKIKEILVTVEVGKTATVKIDTLR